MQQLMWVSVEVMVMVIDVYQKFHYPKNHLRMLRKSNQTCHHQDPVSTTALVQLDHSEESHPSSWKQDHKESLVEYYQEGQSSMVLHCHLLSDDRLELNMK